MSDAETNNTVIIYQDEVIAESGGGGGGGGGSDVEPNPSGTPTDTLTKLGIDGTVYEIQGGGGSTYFGVFVDADNVIQPFINITDTQIHTYTAIKDCAVVYYIPNDTNTDVFIKLDGIVVGGQYGQYINATSGIVYMKKGQVFTYQSTYSASSGAGYTVYGLQSGSETSYFQPIIYSTEEREVGVWINNKPLYQKTLVFENYSSSDYKDVSVLNIEEVVASWGEHKQANGDYSLSFPYYENSNWYSLMTFDKTNERYYVYCSSNMANSYPYLYVTIQYTKTTDVAGSGAYNTLGVPNVHYTTDEQVIGTWLGKPLYRAVLDFSSSPIAIPNTQWLKINNTWAIQPIYGRAIITSSRACMELAVDCDDNDGLYIRSYFTYSQCDYVIIEYTKDSD